MATALSRLMEVEAILDTKLSELKKLDEYDAAAAGRVDSGLSAIRTKTDTILGTQDL
jgi:tRNA U38,U39,U40 pseudouridine synthase TruA